MKILMYLYRVERSVDTIYSTDTYFKKIVITFIILFIISLVNLIGIFLKLLFVVKKHLFEGQQFLLFHFSFSSVKSM